MRTAKLITALLLGAAIMGTSSVAAWAQSEFLFNGYSRTMSGTPDAVGSAIEIYGTISTTGGVPTPIALDLVNYQYTIHVEGMTVGTYTYVPPPPFPQKQIVYNGGLLRMFADAKVGGTAASYAVPATFTDGELVLVASVDPIWTLLLSDLPPTDGRFTGSGSGKCDFYDGTQLDAFIAAEYYFNDWNFLGVPVADPNPPFTTVPAGFQRRFDIKLTPPNDPSPVFDRTWGGVKAIFR